MKRDDATCHKAALGSAFLAAAIVVGISTSPTPAAAEDLVIGFIYVSPRDDFGYGQSHAESAAAVRQLDGVQVIEAENVPESVEVMTTIESMINIDGAKLMFPTSFGYFPHVKEMAAKYPDIAFFHAGGPWDEGNDPANFHSYFGSLYQAHYLAGVAAGHATESNVLGFVAAMPIGVVLNNINAWTLGAKTANPDVTVRLIFTGDWSLPVREAEATNSLIDQGADVISMHVDSPKVIVETARRRGVFVTGHNADQSPLAPDLYLTGAQYNWEVPVLEYVERYRSGEALDNYVRGGFEKDYVKIHPYGPAVSDESKEQIEALKAELQAGEERIFVGPLRDNLGNLVIPEGTVYTQHDPWTEQMNFLVEGIIGDLPG